MSDHETLFAAICNGDRNTVIRLVQGAVDSGQDVGQLLKATMIPAMGEVGERFSRNQIYVPEMLVAARAMQGGMSIIEPILAGAGHESIGRVCIGSVKGDLHDIGKNLVTMMLKGAGFTVDDLGVDVRVPVFEQAVERGARVVCLSALLTTTMNEMRAVINHFQGRDDISIVVGGAVITQEFAREIGADGFGADASDAVRAVKQCLKIPV